MDLQPHTSYTSSYGEQLLKHTGGDIALDDVTRRSTVNITNCAYAAEWFLLKQLYTFIQIIFKRFQQISNPNPSND